MADQCIMTEDVAFASDATKVTLSLASPLMERIKAGDSQTFRIHHPLFELARVADASYRRPSVLVMETISVRDAILGVRSQDAFYSDRLRVRDRVVGSFSNLVAESLDVGERTTWRRRVQVAEAIAVAESVALSPVHSVRVADVIRAGDASTARRKIRVSETVAVAERLSSSRRTAFADSLVAADAYLLASAGSDSLAELIRAGEAWTVKVSRKVSVAEEACIEDAYLLAGTASAWTANTDTWAASRYASLPFSSLLVIDDVLFGVGEAGLYALDGDTDEGRPVAASLLTDERQATGNLALSLGGYMYAAMTSGGRMGARVFDTSRGQRHSYEYVFEDRRNDALGPMRIKYGRGIKTLFWQFEIFNVEGADFRIAGGLAWTTDPTSRRV